MFVIKTTIVSIASTKSGIKTLNMILMGYNKLRRDNPLYQNKYREMKAMPEYKTFKLMERRIPDLDALRKENPERYERKIGRVYQRNAHDRGWLLKNST